MKSLEEIEKIRNIRILASGVDGGMGYLQGYGNLSGSVIWSTGGGWEHVSVSPFKKRHTPTWEEMCLLKDLFFKEDEVVIQYHPAKSEYVNQMKNCLHLWRPIKEKLPVPPTVMVGVKNGQTKEEILAAIEKIYEDSE